MPARTILLLDDDPHFRRLVRAALESAGHRVVEATTGAEASAIEWKEKVDLAVVDGLLPDMDGSTWIAALRKRGSRIPVVFVTAVRRNPSSFARLVRELAVDTVVLKPVVPSSFSEQIAELLRRAYEPSGPAEPPRVTPVRPREDAAVAPGPPAPPASQELARLVAEYATELPEKVLELWHSVAVAHRFSGDPIPLQEAAVFAHRLRGSAGSYGQPEVGECAGEVEEALRALIEDASAAGAWERISAALARAQQLAEEAASRGIVLRPAAEPVEAGPAAAATPGTLLVVDDDPDFLAHVREAGRTQLLRVLTARDPEEAIRQARTFPPDAALLDVWLGAGPEGFNLARQLRLLPGCASLPLGFVSSDRRVLSRLHAARAGASIFVTKPLDPGAFCEAARELMALGKKDRPRLLLSHGRLEVREAAQAVLAAAGYQIRVLADPSEVVDVLERESADVVLLDPVSNGVAGIDLCRVLRMHPDLRELPVAFLSAVDSRELRRAAFRAGGDDFLVHPVSEEELTTHIGSLVERTRLRTDRDRVDPLTGLLRRQAFAQELEKLARPAADGRRPEVTLVLLDVNHLRWINSTHGHGCGDRILATLGQHLLVSLDSSVLRGRWGGDEVALAFADCPPPEVAERMRALAEEFGTIPFLGRTGAQITASVTTALAVLSETDSAEALSRLADERLHQAKAARAAAFAAQLAFSGNG